MKRKKTVPITPKKETVQQLKQEFIPSWMSFKLLIVLLLLLAGIVWFGFYATHTKEISGSDDREYASIARNIVNGKGIVRNFIYPVEINLFEKLPVPEFMHPPGYPLILAGFFKLFGTSDFVALLPSYLSYFILVFVFFFFAKQYLGIKTSVIATVMLVFNRELLDISLVALSEGFYTLCFFLFFILLVRANSFRAIFVSGVVLGLSHCIRQNIYPFLVPVLVYLYFYPNLPRWEKMLLFLIGVLIPILPGMVRSYLDTGSFFFSYGKFALMAFSDKYPWLNVYRDIQNPSLFEFLAAEPIQFLLKYLTNLVNIVGEQIFTISNPYLLFFFFVDMFYWKISTEQKRMKWLFLFLLFSQVLFIPLFAFKHRFFIHFLPMMIFFASQSFLRMTEELVSGVKRISKERISLLMASLFLICFVIPATYTILKPNKSPALNFKIPQFGLFVDQEELRNLNEFLNHELKGNQFLLTDLPEIIEWKSERFFGWLPTSIKSVYQIHKKIPVDAILLTNVRTLQQMEEEWQYLLLSDETLPQYRTAKLYRGKRFFAKLLIRDGKE